MALYDRDLTRHDYVTVTDNSFTTRVYGWMTIGLLLTAFVAFVIANTGAYMAILPYCWVIGLATFGIAIAISTLIQRLSFPAVAGLFLAYSTMQGIFFGAVLPLYAAQFGGHLIWTAFATAGLIYGLALGYGLFTKSDLTSIGRILSVALMGLIGISLLYLILSFFIDVTWMNLLISYLGLAIFVGLTAYDAQQIRAMSTQVDSHSVMSYKLSLVMALRMYINVIMIFWYLLQIFSSSQRK
jgi:uncharacterized protein